MLFRVCHSGLVVPENRGNETVPEVVTTSGYALLHFFSDAAYNLTGFNIAYSYVLFLPLLVSDNHSLIGRGQRTNPTRWSQRAEPILGLECSDLMDITEAQFPELTLSDVGRADEVGWTYRLFSFWGKFH